MARTRKKAGRIDPAALDSATVAKAARMVQRLRDHHAMGRKANEAKASIKEFAAEHGFTENTMRKIRAFAGEYTPDDLKTLCSLRRPNGLPLQWGHIPYLLIVKDRMERLKLQQKAAHEGWTAPRLNDAIPKKHRSQSGHGRTMHRPTTAAEGLHQLKSDSERWLRRCSVIMEVVMGGGAKKLASLKLKDLAASLDAALAQIEQRARTVRSELQSAGLGKRGT